MCGWGWAALGGIKGSESMIIWKFSGLEIWKRGMVYEGVSAFGVYLLGG